MKRQASNTTYRSDELHVTCSHPTGQVEDQEDESTKQPGDSSRGKLFPAAES